jgi:hypothetical protein
MRRMNIVIPFLGFWGTRWEAMLEDLVFNQRGHAPGVDLGPGFAHLAQEYPGRFCKHASKMLGIDFPVRHEKTHLKSRGNYQDVVTVIGSIPVTTARALYDLSAQESHLRLQEDIRERVRKRPEQTLALLGGLIEKPLESWIDRELGVLLFALLTESNVDEIEVTAYEEMIDDGVFDVAARMVGANEMTGAQ